MIFRAWIGKRTACQTSDVLDCVPGCGLSDGGADDSAESLSDPDESCQYTTKENLILIMLRIHSTSVRAHL